jgi:hypothetical protein
MPLIKRINKLKLYLLNDNSLHNHKLNTKTTQVQRSLVAFFSKKKLSHIEQQNYM